MKPYPCCNGELSQYPTRIWIHRWQSDINPILSLERDTILDLINTDDTAYIQWYELPLEQLEDWKANQNMNNNNWVLDISGTWNYLQEDYLNNPRFKKDRCIIALEIGKDVWIAGTDIGLWATYNTDSFTNTSIGLTGTSELGFLKTGQYYKEWIDVNTVCFDTCSEYWCEPVGSDYYLSEILDCLVIDFMNAPCGE